MLPGGRCLNLAAPEFLNTVGAFGGEILP